MKWLVGAPLFATSESDAQQPKYQSVSYSSVWPPLVTFWLSDEVAKTALFTSLRLVLHLRVSFIQIVLTIEWLSPALHT